MSYTRLKYDDNTYKYSLAATVEPGNYMTQTPRNCDNCVYYAPGIILDGKADVLCDKALIDIDSELLNITRKNSQCPADKYIPDGKAFCNYYSTLKECTDLVPEPTLISNPKCTGHEVTVNRWEWLCKNPQDKSLVPFDYLINNRLIVKDNHRPLIERPLDQSCALPPVDNNKIIYDWSSKWLNCNNSQVNIPNVPVVKCKNIREL